MAQANAYFASDAQNAAIPAMAQIQGLNQQNTLARQQGLLFQQDQQAREKALQNDALFKNSLVKFLGPVNAGMVIGDQAMSTQGPINSLAQEGGGIAPTNGQPNEQQNALIQMLQANPEAGLQIAQYQQRQQALQAEAQRENAVQQQAARVKQAQDGYRKIQWAEDRAKEGVSLRHTFDIGFNGEPAIQKLKEQLGGSFDNASEEQLKQWLGDMKQQLAPIAGIAPEKPENPVALAEGAQLINPKTGKLIAENRKDTTAERGANDQRMFDRANKLRDEFNTQNKDFGQVASQYQNIVATSAKPSAAGDISLIFSFMKMLDPASTVREGEFATAQNSGSAFNRVGAMYNKAMSGERLTETQRADFVGQATNIFKTRNTQKEKLTKKYSEFARRTGVDPLDVVGGPENENPSQGTAPAASGLPGGWTVKEH